MSYIKKLQAIYFRKIDCTKKNLLKYFCSFLAQNLKSIFKTTLIQDIQGLKRFSKYDPVFPKTP